MRCESGCKPVTETQNTSEFEKGVRMRMYEDFMFGHLGFRHFYSIVWTILAYTSHRSVWQQVAVQSTRQAGGQKWLKLVACLCAPGVCTQVRFALTSANASSKAESLQDKRLTRKDEEKLQQEVYAGPNLQVKYIFLMCEMLGMIHDAL